MNILDWVTENLGPRIALASELYINTKGETFTCTISEPNPRHYVLVTYTHRGTTVSLEIHLSNLLPMSDESLYFFGRSDPNGQAGTLVIPAWRLRGDGPDDEDDDELEDE